MTKSGRRLFDSSDPNTCNVLTTLILCVTIFLTVFSVAYMTYDFHVKYYVEENH